jgi:hypothetical protein
LTDQAPADVTNLDQTGSPAMPWSRAHDLLAAPPKPNMPGGDHPSFLCTVRPVGRPHATGVAARWYDGDVYFTSGPSSRKSRNLAANPACTIAMTLAGLDLVLDGEAAKVSDPKILEAVAAVCRQGGWPVEVVNGAFTAPFAAPDAGPPPWPLYRFTFHTAIGHATAEPWGATRWRFAR